MNSMGIIFVISCFAALFELCGIWLVGNKRRMGFVLNGVACLLWITTALLTEVTGLLIVAVPALVINIRNFRKWSKIS